MDRFRYKLILDGLITESITLIKTVINIIDLDLSTHGRLCLQSSTNGRSLLGSGNFVCIKAVITVAIIHRRSVAIITEPTLTYSVLTEGVLLYLDFLNRLVTELRAGSIECRIW